MHKNTKHLTARQNHLTAVILRETATAAEGLNNGYAAASEQAAGNHLHWYGVRTTKINGKTNQTNTKKQYNNILPTYTCTQT